MPFGGSRGAGAAGGDGLAGFEPGFTARARLCFTACDSRRGGLRLSGSGGSVRSCDGPRLHQGEEKESLLFSSGLPPNLSVSCGGTQIDPNETAAAPSPRGLPGGGCTWGFSGYVQPSHPPGQGHFQ